MDVIQKSVFYLNNIIGMTCFSALICSKITAWVLKNHNFYYGSFLMSSFNILSENIEKC